MNQFTNQKWEFTDIENKLMSLGRWVKEDWRICIDLISLLIRSLLNSTVNSTPNDLHIWERFKRVRYVYN